MKYLQIPVNASNLNTFLLFTPKGHPRVCWVIWIFLQLQLTVIDNTRVNTIDMIDTIDTIDMIDKINKINKIDRIDCINKYKDNRYDQSDQLTL